jgi:hypothetical protein
LQPDFFDMWRPGPIRKPADDAKPGSTPCFVLGGTERAKQERNMASRKVRTKKPKAVVTQDREVRTYSELWYASQKMMEAGIREPVGSAWHFLSSLVLTAFAFEAYLNHIGPTLLKCWESVEYLSLANKLDLICELLNVQVPDKGKRPGQTIEKLFKFRNTLAHGRTETVTAPSKRMDPDYVDQHFMQRPLTWCEKLIRDGKFARQAREDVEVVVKMIHDARRDPKDYPFTFGMAFGSATMEDGNQ